jgi:membrane protein
VTPGSVLALVLWIVASLGFTLDVATFSSYNETFGSIGAVLVFLVWLWLTNIAILLGAEIVSRGARPVRQHTRRRALQPDASAPGGVPARRP